jgi:hypothetical protein
MSEEQPLMDEMGESPPAMDAAEAPEEKPAEKPAAGSVKSVKSVKAAPVAAAKTVKVMTYDAEEDMCCCCLCKCSEPETKDLSCCACFPIKCGILIIGFLILVITVVITVELLACFLNEYLAWWYVAVAFLIIIPLFIASSFVVNFYVKDDEGSRGKLWVACQFVIISFTLLAIWNVLYFYYWYHHDSLYVGSAEQGYTKKSKKVFLVWTLLITIVIDALFAYFICVCVNYSSARASPDAVPEEGMKAPELPSGGCCCGGDEKAPEEMEAAKK